MSLCLCIKADGQQCTRKAMTKPNKTYPHEFDPQFCWQHQNCDKSVKEKKIIKKHKPIKEKKSVKEKKIIKKPIKEKEKKVHIDCDHLGGFLNDLSSCYLDTTLFSLF